MSASPDLAVALKIYDMVEHDPVVRTEIRRIALALPRRDKCLASIALGAAGLVVTAFGALGLVTGDALTVGIGVTTSAAVLIREFCSGVTS